MRAASHHRDRFDFKPFEDPREAVGGDVSGSLNPHGLWGGILIQCSRGKTFIALFI